MKFYADWRAYNTRYGAGLIAFLSGCAWMFFYPIVLGKGLMFLELFKGAFFTDIRLTGFFLGIILFTQVNCYFVAYNYIHILEIQEYSVVFNLFSFYKDKIIKINYSEIQSIAYTEDIYKNFEFTLKTGEKKVIYATIKNKQQAFDLIQQKIADFR